MTRYADPQLNVLMKRRSKQQPLVVTIDPSALVHPSEECWFISWVQLISLLELHGFISRDEEFGEVSVSDHGLLFSMRHRGK